MEDLSANLMMRLTVWVRLHIVSAWASEEGIALGQVATEKNRTKSRRFRNSCNRSI